MNIKVPVTVALLLLSVVSQAKIYTWVDEHGKKHFSDTPPANHKAEEKTVSTSTVTFAAPATSKKETQETKALPADGAIETAPNKDPKLCQQAKKDLATIDNAPRLRMKQDNGEYFYLSDEQRKQQRASRLKAIEDYCG